MVLQPGAEQGLQAVEAVRGLFGEAQGLAVAEAGEQHLGSDVAEGWVGARLGLDEREDEQQPHAGGEGGLLGLLQEALPFEQGHRLLVPRALPLLLLLQGQLSLCIPQPAQRVQAVLQQPRVGVALVTTHRAQPLSEFRGVLGLERQDLKRKFEILLLLLCMQDS